MEKAEIDAHLRPAQDLIKRKKPREALEQLERILQQWKPPKDALWRVYEYYATCYYGMADLQKWRKYGWATVTAAEGQPRRIQQGNLSNYVFMMHYFPDVSDKELRDLHFIYDQFAQAERPFRHPLSRHRHKKIRIGYLTEALSENVVNYFSQHLMTMYDSDRFEVYAYGVRHLQDGITDTLRQHVKKLKIYSDPFMVRKTAEEIYEDEIDILFDMDLHATSGRTLMVMCCRPAPVQIGGIGYMSTSGTRALDYFLGDPYCDPPGLNEKDFAEQILRMPHTHLGYFPSERVRNQVVRKPYQPHHPIVFGSFNNFFKLNDDVLEAWLEISRRVQDSHFLIKNSTRKTCIMEVTRQRLLDAGFRPDQFTLEDTTKDYMQRYNDVDIMLDTYPYTGGATTCESLLMGVPVVARYGRRHGSRFSYSLLMNAGLGDLACRTREEYITLAVALAKSPALLQRLHATIPHMFESSPVMNAQQYVRDLESLYERIWQTWLTKKGK